MAKTSAIQRNLKRIRLSKKFLKKRQALKKIINDKKMPLDERFKAQLKLSKLPRNGARTRIRNRCEITGRPHGVYRKLRISRIALRDLASKGNFRFLIIFLSNSRFFKNFLESLILFKFLCIELVFAIFPQFISFLLIFLIKGKFIAFNKAKEVFLLLPFVQRVISMPLIRSTLSKFISGNIMCSLRPNV